MTTEDTTGNDPEHVIRQAWLAGDYAGAATHCITEYGEQMTSFLRSRFSRSDDASEAFAIFAESLWVALPAFEWRCSMRTYCYKLARSAAARQMRSPARRAARNLPVSLAEQSELSMFIDRARSATLDYMKTEVKEDFRALRAELGVEEQMLLVLRVERSLGWRDLAIALSDNADLSDEELNREAARLRKVYERLKGELRRLARDKGLL